MYRLYDTSLWHQYTPYYIYVHIYISIYIYLYLYICKYIYIRIYVYTSILSILHILHRPIAVQVGWWSVLSRRKLAPGSLTEGPINHAEMCWKSEGKVNLSTSGETREPFGALISLWDLGLFSCKTKTYECNSYEPFFFLKSTRFCTEDAFFITPLWC